MALHINFRVDASSIPPLLGWLSSNLHTTGAVGLAIAINISVGAPGQITGVWIYKADQAERGYPTGHGTNAGLLFFVAIGCLCLRLYYGVLNRNILRGEEAIQVLRALDIKASKQDNCVMIEITYDSSRLMTCFDPGLKQY
jgi:hypothetical protein